MKKNNKGFSLVELIVVVLIMGILAVALTPQVMKWVDKSRLAADKDNFEAVKAAAALAVTSDSVYGKGTVSIAITNDADTTGITVTPETGLSCDFVNKFNEYAGGDIDKFIFKRSISATLNYDKTGVLLSTSSIPSDLTAEISE